MTKLDSNWAKVQRTLKKKPGKFNRTPVVAVPIAKLKTNSSPGQNCTQKASTTRSGAIVKCSTSPDAILDLIRTEKGKDTLDSTLQIRADLTSILAIDCEMVGVGASTRRDALARVSIVNFHGDIVLDTLVKPMEAITDHRTQYSGIGRGDLLQAPSFKYVQQHVADIIKERILVGHAIRSDLKALMLSHPSHLIRDTTSRIVCQVGLKSLKHLSKEHLDIDIQEGSHNSVEDARAALALYRKFSVKWEKKVAQGQQKKRLLKSKVKK